MSRKGRYMHRFINSSPRPTHQTSFFGTRLKCTLSFSQLFVTHTHAHRHTFASAFSNKQTQTKSQTIVCHTILQEYPRTFRAGPVLSDICCAQNTPPCSHVFVIHSHTYHHTFAMKTNTKPKTVSKEDCVMY